MAYALVMIVRDGAASIDACLASAKPHISAATIVDTGSTDDTTGRVRTALDGIPLTLVSRPWVNFGVNRSEAFALARNTADWLLALDADMTVEIDPGFRPGCCGEHDVCTTDHWECPRRREQLIDAYMVEMRDGNLSWRLPLLLRGDLEWRSVGPVHEYTTRADGQPYRGVPTDAVRVRFPSTPTSPSKRHWQAGMLEEELARNPDDARSVYYLAQTYREIGDPRAREMYQRRAAMGGFAEEAWHAAYRSAQLAPWPGQAAELMAVWEMRPTRLEPLHALVSELNRRGCHRAAYALAEIPVETTTDLLFVERWIWDWGMAFERAIAAWWVGRKPEAAALNDRLLARTDLPDEYRAAVERNRAL